MAIAYGTITSLDTTGTYNGPTISGSNTLGIVEHMGDTGDNLTGITWVKGGTATAMTFGAKVQVPNDRYIYLYYITNPDSAGQIVVSGSGTKHSRASYYTGVDQTSPKDATATNTSSTSATIAVTVNVGASNCWIVYYQKDNNGGKTYTTSVGTMRYAGGDGTGMAMGDTNGTVGTGNQTVTLTQNSGTNNHAIIGMSIAPYVEPASVNSNFLSFM